MTSLQSPPWQTLCGSQQMRRKHTPGSGWFPVCVAGPWLGVRFWSVELVSLQQGDSSWDLVKDQTGFEIRGRS